MKANHLGVQVRLLGAALLVLAASLPVRADYQSTVLSQGPIGYWRLNETTATTANTLATNRVPGAQARMEFTTIRPHASWQDRSRAVCGGF